jgi:hypothetical protein
VLSQPDRDMTHLTQTLRHICVLSYALLSSFECAAVFDLQKKFANEYNILCLHVWMLLVRLRSEGKDGKDIAQMVYETFQDNVEARVRGEGVKVSTLLCPLSMALGAILSCPPSLVMHEAAVSHIVLQCWHICSFPENLVWVFLGTPCNLLE